MGGQLTVTGGTFAKEKQSFGCQGDLLAREESFLANITRKEFRVMLKLPRMGDQTCPILNLSIICA